MKSFTARDRYMAMFLAVMSLILLGVLLWEWEQGKQLERELLKLRVLPATAVPPQKVLPEFTWHPCRTPARCNHRKSADRQPISGGAWHDAGASAA